MKATHAGILQNIDNCYIVVPNPSSPVPFGQLAGGSPSTSSFLNQRGPTTITMRILPEIGDSKGAAYGDEPIMGRSSPVKIFSHGENRSITWTIHFIAESLVYAQQNLRNLRAIQSCVYPRDSDLYPYTPPAVCRIKCGQLLSNNEICCILRNYNVRFPTDVPWDEDTYIPWKFDLDTSWEEVFTTSSLPGADKIFNDV